MVRSKKNGSQTKKGTRVSHSARAGLTFPVGRMHRYLKKGRYAARTSKVAAVQMAAILEYVTAEVLELSGDVARKENTKTLKPQHILLAVRSDTELNKLTSKAIFAHSGSVPFMNSGKSVCNDEEEEETQESQTF